jgi:hypothetical protein
MQRSLDGPKLSHILHSQSLINASERLNIPLDLLLHNSKEPRSLPYRIKGLCLDLLHDPYPKPTPFIGLNYSNRPLRSSKHR